MTDAASQPEPVQPQPQAPPQAGTDTLDPKIGGLLSYLLFGWIGGLIMYLTQKNPEVRFHAAQSILTFGGLSILSLLLNVVFPFAGLTGLGLLALLSGLLWLASVVLWILLSIKGYQLEHFKLPVVGDIAEQWAAR